MLHDLSQCKDGGVLADGTPVYVLVIFSDVEGGGACIAGDFPHVHYKYRRERKENLDNRVGIYIF